MDPTPPPPPGPYRSQRARSALLAPGTSRPRTRPPPEQGAPTAKTARKTPLSASRCGLPPRPLRRSSPPPAARSSPRRSHGPRAEPSARRSSAASAHPANSSLRRTDHGSGMLLQQDAHHVALSQLRGFLAFLGRTSHGAGLLIAPKVGSRPSTPPDRVVRQKGGDARLVHSWRVPEATAWDLLRPADGGPPGESASLRTLTDSTACAPGQRLHGSSTWRRPVRSPRHRRRRAMTTDSRPLSSQPWLHQEGKVIPVAAAARPRDDSGGGP